MTYEQRTEQLQQHTGERVRLTYPNGYQDVGVVSAHDYGHCVDVRLDGHGGQSYENVVAAEVMGDNGRYAPMP